MAVPVILPTFGKSRKTTKSDPSTGDQLGKREFLFNNNKALLPYSTCKSYMINWNVVWR